MNKKIFATALFAVAAFVSTGASAAVSYGNSVGSGAQTDNAIINAGGTSRANDLTITSGGNDIPADSEIIVRLPAGMNFVGTPVYAVSQATTNSGLTLKDDSEFGDPTLGADTGVALFDTNADGKMDRAVVVVSSDALSGDTLTVSINVSAAATATAGNKNASIIVNGGLAETVVAVKVVTDTLSGVISATGNDLVTADQSGNTGTVVNGASFDVIIPAGAEDGDTITFTPNGKLQWNLNASTETLTVNTVYTPYSILPLTGTSLIGVVSGANAATSTITLALQGAPDGVLANDVVLALNVDTADIVAGAAVGNLGLSIGGTAGVSGTANLFSVKENGSSAALKSGATLTSIVEGSTSAQTLPDIVITENFDGDALSTTSTVTITAGEGLKFVANQTATLSISDAGATINAGGTSTTSVIVLELTDASTTKTITISGIKATIDADTVGNVSLTVGGASIDSSTGPNNTFAVANAVEVGSVSVTGPATPAKLGTGSTGATAEFVLAESTYGAVTRAAYSTTTTNSGSSTTEAFFKVTPTNASIQSVAVSTATISAGGAPSFAACASDAPADSYTCVVSAESSTLSAGDTFTVTVTYDVDGSVGETVSMALSGNSGIEGSADVATVVDGTAISVNGALPILKEGLTTAQAVAAITISEKVSSSIADGLYRIIAPAGVVFATPYPEITSGLTGGASATVAVSTFAPNDTLVIHTEATPTITISANVIVASSVQGYISFDVLDGDLDGNNKTNIVADSVDVAYADKTLTALDAGSAIAVNVGFTSASRAITGGLVGDGYTVVSSNTGTVTVSQTGASFTVHGVAAGSANVTVTDELGATDVVAVTVSTGAAVPAAVKGVNTASAAGRTGVTFSAGATSDGGTTYGDTFTVDDEVTIIATVGVDSTDVGSAGAIHIAGRLEGNVFVYLDEDGLFADWDISGLPGANIVTESLEASYTVTVVDGEKLPAGEHRFALAYSTGSEVIYTGKAIVITITE